MERTDETKTLCDLSCSVGCVTSEEEVLRFAMGRGESGLASRSASTCGRPMGGIALWDATYVTGLDAPCFESVGEGVSYMGWEREGAEGRKRDEPNRINTMLWSSEGESVSYSFAFHTSMDKRTSKN